MEGTSEFVDWLLEVDLGLDDDNDEFQPTQSASQWREFAAHVVTSFTRSCQSQHMDFTSPDLFIISTWTSCRRVKGERWIGVTRLALFASLHRDIYGSTQISY
jgi:hypothetical protein